MEATEETLRELNAAIEKYELEIDDLKEEVDDLKDGLADVKEALEEKQARIEELEEELASKEPATVLDQLKKEIIDRFIELPISELTFIEDMYFKGKII